MRTTAKPSKLPRMGLHRATGQARVTLNGQPHYLGKWGTAEAHARYAELIRQWQAGGQIPLRAAVTAPQAMLTVRGLFDAFLDFCTATGRYRKAGKVTSQGEMFAWVARSLDTALGNVPVAKLTEGHLVSWRDVLERDHYRTRKGINRLVGAAISVLRWGRVRGMVPKPVFADVAMLEPLRRGEVGSRPEHGRARRAVTMQEIEQVAAHAGEQVGDMLRVQGLTGMRPGEVCAMKWRNIDKRPIAGDASGCWTYTVEDAKTAHHGTTTRYYLPPVVQAILAKYAALPTACMFSPRTAMQERSEVLRASRQTPPTKQMQERDAADPQVEYADHWDTHAYRRAVERACVRAGVDRFTPHEVRHGFLTWAATNLSVMAASAAANHRSTNTTARYLHAGANDALAVAAAVQARAVGS